MKKTVLSLCLSLCLPATASAYDLLPDIAVADSGQHVVINIPQLRLFLFEDGAVRNVYPIAVGKNRTQTPPGEYAIGTKAYKPTWHIPISIQKERAQQGLPALTTIPPGPSNPLGPVFVRFGKPSLGLGIHGTNAPSSVPGVRSHGCVRMKSDNALAFADTVETETPVSVIYQRYALNQDDDGQLWLAVYSNPYQHKNDDLNRLTDTLKLWAQHNKAEIDMARLQPLLKKPTKPFCLTCTTKNTKVTGVLHPLAWQDVSAEIRQPYVAEPPLPEIRYNIHTGSNTVRHTPRAQPVVLHGGMRELNPINRPHHDAPAGNADSLF